MLRQLLDSPRTYYLLAGVLLVAAVLSQFEIRWPARPEGKEAELAALRARDDVNVLFILIDALRADRLSAYGYERQTSPWIDELARTGVRFARVSSQSSWTKCSMASLWTATYPIRNGILRWGHALPGESLLASERLREAGFRTAGIIRNGWVAPTFGFDQGFQSYVQPRSSGLVGEVPRRSPRRHERLKGSDEHATRVALEFLRTFGDKRFFLYVHYMDVHQYTYSEDSALFGSSYSDAYDNAIHWTDQNLGVLLQELEERGLRDRTLVVVAADHGEEFREHGQEGHGRSLYREVVEVPWIIGLPFRLNPGVVVETAAENVDIWPTLLDLLGLPALPASDGSSQLPLIEAAITGAAGAASAPDDAALGFSHLDRNWGNTSKPPRPFVRVTQGPYHLILEEGLDERDKVELFDVSGDPQEATDISADHPELTARLLKQATDYLDRPPAAWGPPQDVEISDLEAGQLRALGYLVR